MTGFRISPLSRPESLKILTWRYEAPFDFYNPPQPVSSEDFVEQLMKPQNGFYGVRDANNCFVGFCSFGTDGQVLGGQYPKGPLDIGLGMAPSMTGRGTGKQFFAALIEFAQRQYTTDRFRLTVASFNRRAIKVYEDFGFEPCHVFNDFTDQMEHIIMSCELDSSVSSGSYQMGTSID